MDAFLLFMLFAANNNPKLMDQLRSFLTFYRENRELIALMTKNTPTMPAVEHEKISVETKSQPQSEVGACKILEEYLSRFA